MSEEFNSVVETASAEVAAEQTVESQSTEETTVEETQEESPETPAVVENTELTDEQFANQYEGETVSKKAFLDRLNKKNTQYKEATEKLTNFEKFKDKDYLLNLENMIEQSPNRDAIIKLMTEKAKEEAQVDGEEVDPVELLKSEFEADKKEREVVKYQAYEDEYQVLVKEAKYSGMQDRMIKGMVESTLDTNSPGWRTRHIPGLVGEAYKFVQGELNTLFNGQKKEYIDSKVSDTTPDIGKGAATTTTERAPIEDNDAMKDYVNEFYK